MPMLLKCGLDKLLFRSLITGIQQLNSKSQEITDWRVKQENIPVGTDLFSSLLQSRDPETGAKLSHKELVSEAGLFIVAGTDTTITGITATIFYLLHHEGILDRVQREIWDKFDDLEHIRIGSRLSSCELLVSCIQEALRLSPPVPSLLPREILRGGIIIDGEFFSQGVDIAVPHYAIQHDPRYYPEPFSFKPERWMQSVGTSDEDHLNNAYCVFGTGRTSCIGKYLACQEMQLVIARLVWQFEMRILPGSSLGGGTGKAGSLRGKRAEFQLYDRFVSMHKGPMVQFRSREVAGTAS